MPIHASPPSRLKTLAARLGLCAVALAGTVGLTTEAGAVVVTVTRTVAIPNTVDGIYLNLVTGATSTSGLAGFDFNPYSSGTALLFYWGGAASPNNAGVAATTVGPYLDLGIGAVVSSASTFSQNANGANNETAAFLTTGTHRLGLSFLNEATNAVNYGYITLSTTGTTGFPASILGWSYENTGASITVTATPPVTPVPEASTTAMMSLGLLAMGGLAARRQRRSRKAG